MTPSVPAPIKDAAALVLARREARLSQGQLAGLSGMNPVSICRLETGRAKLLRSTGFHLALVLAWVMRRSGVNTVVLAAPKPVGRPYTIKPNEIITRYRTALGVDLASRAAMLALPPGAIVYCIEGHGRMPDETLDPWRKAIRTDHPSQPLRLVS